MSRADFRRLGTVLAVALLVAASIGPNARAAGRERSGTFTASEKAFAQHVELFAIRAWREMAEVVDRLSENLEDALTAAADSFKGWKATVEHWRRQASNVWDPTRDRLRSMTQGVPRSLTKANALAADTLDRLARWMRELPPHKAKVYRKAGPPISI